MNPVLLLILVLLNVTILLVKRTSKCEILSIKTFFKEKIKNLKAVFSSLKFEESNSTNSVNDRLVQHL